MSPNDMDAKVAEAMDIIWAEGRVSTAMIQRRMRIGFIQAANLMDELERRGYVSAARGLEPRKILVGRNGEALA